MSDQLILSPTSLRQFRRCPQQWAFAHIERIPFPSNVKMALGSAAHKAVEVNYLQKVESKVDVPEDVVLDAYSDSFDSETELIEEPEEPVPKAKDDGVRLVKLYHSGNDEYPAIAPRTQPIMVEAPVQFRVIDEHTEGCPRGEGCSCGVVFNATVDLIDDKDAVRELKTTGRTPSGGQHLMQTAAAAIGFEVLTGRPASDMVVDTLVRTKQAKHVEDRWGGPVDAHMRRMFVQQVTSAAKMIQSGNFPMLGVEGVVPACGTCAYKSICPVWRKR